MKVSKTEVLKHLENKPRPQPKPKKVEVVELTTNPRTAFISDVAIMKLCRIPINQDCSPRKQAPYLYGPPWEVRCYNSEGNTETICKCKDEKEAANIAMLLLTQYEEVCKYIVSSRKAIIRESKRLSRSNTPKTNR